MASINMELVLFRLLKFNLNLISSIHFERPPVQDVDVPPDHEVARPEEVLPAQPLRRRELVRFCVQTLH